MIVVIDSGLGSLTCGAPAVFLAARVASCLLGGMPPRLFLAVCLVRLICAEIRAVRRGGLNMIGVQTQVSEEVRDEMESVVRGKEDNEES